MLTEAGYNNMPHEIVGRILGDIAVSYSDEHSRT